MQKSGVRGHGCNMKSSDKADATPNQLRMPADRLWVQSPCIVHLGNLLLILVLLLLASICLGGCGFLSWCHIDDTDSTPRLRTRIHVKNSHDTHLLSTVIRYVRKPPVVPVGREVFGVSLDIRERCSSAIRFLCWDSRSTRRKCWYLSWGLCA
jgi:hypothetical protein